MRIRVRQVLAVVGASALLVAGLAACSSDTDTPNTGNKPTVDQGFKIGLLLPESKTTRYETFDRPLIEAKLKELCPKCEVLYQNADQDSAKQQSQAEAMLTQGVKVLILDAVDATAAGGVVENAKSQGACSCGSCSRRAQSRSRTTASWVTSRTSTCRGRWGGRSAHWRCSSTAWSW